ncbi:hypothetical protein [Candidatus Nitrosotalea okcheonensis]|uniref:Uncharacterized protein n=1 Tax=Candidatus Nitrosotalea okcheonensis TaxID=1903276 RepID=A0A2H1FE78_9ARCH|nr:hypothetical protein [Candidatus Nitrosotalea okcheonensis]SMH71063.1 protein of unknown function [Candidatus Nitrosotalea okcheonensis]
MVKNKKNNITDNHDEQIERLFVLDLRQQATGNKELRMKRSKKYWADLM